MGALFDKMDRYGALSSNVWEVMSFVKMKPDARLVREAMVMNSGLLASGRTGEAM